LLFHRRELAGRKGKRVIVLAAIERSPVPVFRDYWIEGFLGRISEDAELGSSGTLQPVAVEETAITED